MRPRRLCARLAEGRPAGGELSGANGMRRRYPRAGSVKSNLSTGASVLLKSVSVRLIYLPLEEQEEEDPRGQSEACGQFTLSFSWAS